MSIVRSALTALVVFFGFASASLAQAPDPRCSVPGMEVVTDPAGDQSPLLPISNPLFDETAFDITRVSIAEPVVAGTKRLVITLKVASLETLPPNGYWTVFFTNGDTEYFVSMQNAVDDGGVSYVYGHTELIGQTTNQTTDGDLLAESGYTADGTITLVGAASTFETVPGGLLTNVNANTQQLIGIGFTGGLLQTYDDTDADTDNSYTLAAADACGSTGGGGPGTATVRAADARDPSFLIYPTTATIQSDLFGAGEPTLDVNYATGSVFMRFILGTAKAVFTDAPTGTTVQWTDVTDPIDGLTSIPGLDPFLGGSYIPGADGIPTDSPSRIFSLQLLGAMSAMVYSDDDGETWTPAQGGGQVHGADNQSIAAGPYPEDFLLGPLVLSDFAVYYCSQGTINAFCSRSDDGGMTFKNSFPIFPVDGLCGNHGHVKVGPDGTVYVPMNNPCLGAEGVTLSIDGGITWTYLTVPETAGGRWDSSIAIARDGKTLYYAYAEQGPGGPTSKDEAMVIKGTLVKTAGPQAGCTPSPCIAWDERGATNVGALTGAAGGLNNIVFSTMVAGDADRAAVIFHGTTQAGDSGAPAEMAGAVWHLYAATTTNGGDTWALRNITPDDPTQKGAICDDGVACTGNTRNLLDFMDAVIDGQGRIVIAFADGFVNNVNNLDYGTLARQSGGPRMYAAFDPPPAAPVVALPVAGDAQVTLDWNDVATATSYKVFQSTVAGAPGVEIATPTVSTAIISGLTNGTPYYFTVKAVNAAGDSAASNEVSATPSAGETALTASLAATSFSKSPVEGRYPVSEGSPLTVGFTVSTGGGNASTKRYFMDFGDGTSAGPQASATFSHDYVNAGTYHAYAIVTQNNGDSSATSNDVITTTFSSVVVEPGEGTPAAARLTFEFTDDNVAPAAVRFTTTGSTGISYVLDFGDGDSPTEPNRITGPGAPAGTLTHTYNVPGTYTVKLRMTGDQAPTSDETTLTITVVAQRRLTAQLSVSPSTVIAGNTATPVTMDASQTVPANGKQREDYTYTFNFGDGSDPVGPGTAMTAQHVYTRPGTYELVLTVSEATQGVAAKSATTPKAGATGPTTSIVRSEVKVTSAQIQAPAERSGGALDALLMLPLLLLGLKRIRRFRA